MIESHLVSFKIILAGEAAQRCRGKSKRSNALMPSVRPPSGKRSQASDARVGPRSAMNSCSTPHWTSSWRTAFERTSIEAITAAAGMAKRTVYARYGDKTTLFKAALTRAIEEWIVPVGLLQAAESDDLEETLLRIGQILVANVLSPGGQRLLRLTNAVSGQNARDRCLQRAEGDRAHPGLSCRSIPAAAWA